MTKPSVVYVEIGQDRIPYYPVEELDHREFARSAIMQVLAEGIAEAEEVDDTTDKLTQLVWPYLQYMKDTSVNSPRFQRDLKDLKETVDRWAESDNEEVQFYNSGMIRILADFFEKYGTH